jgi:hypothetical protein
VLTGLRAHPPKGPPVPRRQRAPRCGNYTKTPRTGAPCFGLRLIASKVVAVGSCCAPDVIVLIP